VCPPTDSKDVKRSEAMRVCLLGGFKVSVGSRTIESGAWRLRKASSLVKLLALAPSHRLHREQVMDLLWPDSGTRAASNNLRKTLHAARRILDPAMGSRYLASEDESLVLCPKSDLWLDVEAFEQAAAAARRAKEPAAYRAAIDLYAGELLPEDRYEDWAENRREELRRTFLSVLVELAGIYEQHGEYGPGVNVLRKVVAEEPTNQEALTGLMRLYAHLGSKVEALAQYERLKVALSKQLGSEPAAMTTRLRDEIVTGKFPPVRTQPGGLPLEELPDGGKHNLPAPRTSLVGREREMVKVKRELAMTRLLTLTGAGGSGKTRLALEVARDLVGAYPDGVWLVELAGLTERTLVPQAVAGASGVLEHPGEPLIDTLVDTLQVRNLLLVVDNCEHLVEDAARLVDVLLVSCPRLRVLATSREALDLPGETSWPVPPLSVPDSRDGPTVGPTVEELEKSESARLFLARARNRNPSFAFTPENAQAVVQICRQLEGLPLAIELAAARIGTLSLKQISQRLGSSLELLTRGGRTAVPRQRTLKKTLDWSHNLLSEPERKLFRRLSVFAGGWTLEASEAVASGEDIEEGEVLDLLSELVEKSLVAAEPTAEGGVRYRKLEPVRQYAREKLEESGETEEIQRRHASFFLALAEEAKTTFPGPEEAWWLHRLEAEHDNLRAALSWSLGDGSRGLGLQLAAALWWFWSRRGHFGEGARWLEGALGKDDRAEPTARAGALYGLGFILGEQNDYGRAQACLEEALALYEELGDRGRVAESLTSLGWMAYWTSGAARAAALYEQSLAVARRSANRRDIPRTLTGLASIVFEEGDYERAQKLWGEALAAHREQGEALGAASVLTQMGYTELARWGNHEQATVLFEEALALGRELEHEQTVADGLLCLGIAANLQGEPEKAKMLLKDSLAIYLKLEMKAELTENVEGLAEAAGALGEGPRAARLWGAADELRRVSRPWSSTERMLHEPLLAAARSRLDEATWEAAFSEGKAMTLEQAVEYALSKEEPATPTTQAPDQPTAHAQQPSLTHREEEVAVLVARGFSNRQISTKLGISERTAGNHVARILRKLGLRSRTQIASWATEHRLSTPHPD
jgi:predicted ATPase/DNA-binding SARP family transcriptional activator/DNA-binding CsgD family transcriptional regulator